MTREEAVKLIMIEREKQTQNPQMVELDTRNSTNDFVAYITAYAGRAAENVLRNEREGCDSLSMFIKVGALVLAALETGKY